MLSLSFSWKYCVGVELLCVRDAYGLATGAQCLSIQPLPGWLVRLSIRCSNSWLKFRVCLAVHSVGVLGAFRLSAEAAGKLLDSCMKICLQGLKYHKLHGRVADNISMATEILLSVVSPISSQAPSESIKSVYKALHQVCSCLHRAVTVVQTGAAVVLGRVLFHAPLEAHTKLVHIIIVELLACFSLGVTRASGSHGSIGDEGVVTACAAALCNAAKAMPADVLVSFVTPVVQHCAIALSRPAHGHREPHRPVPQQAPVTAERSVRCSADTPGPVAAAHAQALHACLACLEVWLVQVPLPGESESTGGGSAAHGGGSETAQTLEAPLRSALGVAYAAARLAHRPGERSAALYAARAIELWLAAHGFEVHPPQQASTGPPRPSTGEGAPKKAVQEPPIPFNYVGPASVQESKGGVAWTAGGVSPRGGTSVGGESPPRTPDGTPQALPPLDLRALQLHDAAAEQQLQAPVSTLPSVPAPPQRAPAGAGGGEPMLPDRASQRSFAPSTAPSRFIDTAEGGHPAAASAAAVREQHQLPLPLDVKRPPKQCTAVRQLVEGARLKVPPWVPTGSLRRLPWEICSVLQHVSGAWRDVRLWEPGLLPQLLTVLAGAVPSVALHCPPRDGPAADELLAAIAWLQPLVQQLGEDARSILPSAVTSVRVVLTAITQCSNKPVGRAAARLMMLLPPR